MGKREKERHKFSVTSFLLIYAMVMASIWVSASYVIAGYATVVYGQPFPIEDLSKTAITAIIMSILGKIGGNMAEHNDGWLFGKSNNTKIKPPDGV